MTPGTIILTGSIAYDTLLSFEGSFGEHFHEAALDHLNLTFESKTLVRAFGGCAANIAYGMTRLGDKPLLWSAVGRDARDYLERFSAWGLPIESLGIFEDCYTAQCFITADRAGNQLSTFHPGAMDRAQEVPPPPGLEKAAAGIISPGAYRSMLAQMRSMRTKGVPVFFDPGQSTPLFSKAELIEFLESSTWLALSDYERELLHAATGLTPGDLARRGLTVFLTLGDAGSDVWLPGEASPIRIGALHREGRAFPVGAGDAYRAGVLFGIARGLDPIACARLGTLMGFLKVASAGAQGYSANLEEVRALYEHTWEKSPF